MTLQETLHELLVRSLRGAQRGALGVRSRALPLTRYPHECVSAAGGLDGRVVVIGLSAVPKGLTPPSGVHVAPVAEAAALATSLRCDPEQRAQIVYLSELASPGEAGLSEFHELRGDLVALEFASLLGLPLLKRIADSSSGKLKERLRLSNVEALWEYAQRARGLEQRQGLDIYSAEIRSLHILQMLPQQLTVDQSPKPSWAQDWDALLGVKLKNSAKAAASALKAADPELAARLAACVPERLASCIPVHQEAPLRWLVKVTDDIAKVASGAPLRDNHGLSADLVKVVRRGEKIISWLLGDGKIPPPPGRTPEDQTPIEVLSGELQHYDQESALITFAPHGEDDNTHIVYPSASDPFIKRLYELDDLQLTSTLLNMGWMSLTSVEALLGKKRLTSEELTMSSRSPTDLSPLEGRVEALLAARRALLDSVRALLSSLSRDEGRQVADAELNAAGGDGEEVPDEDVSWLDVALFIARFPLTAVTRFKEPCEVYCHRYEELMRAASASQSELNEELITWLYNADIIYAYKKGTQTAELARLGTLHPLRVARHLVWAQDGFEPPPLPDALIFNGSQRLIERDYLAHYESDTYISIPEATSTPSPKRFALAARQGLRAAWQALSTLELTSVIDVELIDCPDATAALNALTDELSECVARRDRASSVHLEVYLASKDQRDALTLDRDSLSIEALMSLSTAKGEGLSLCVHRAPLTPDHARARTVKVAAVEAKYQSTTPPAASRAGSLKVTYDVTPSGTIGHVRASGIPAWDAVVELQTQLGARRTLRLGAPKSAEKPLGALVETLVARGGWPRSPEEARGLLAYDLGDQHVIMTCVRPELSTRLIETRLASLNMPTLDLSRLTSLTLGLHDAREFSLSLLDPSADQRKLRGDLGKLRALEALSREPGERLILNLDSPEGRAWSAAVARARGASARRADLVVLEANEGIAAVTQVRVIELKAFERLTQTPEPLIKQARLSAEQIAYTFSALSADGPREALRAFWWHGAGYARRAHAWQKALRDLDDRLSEHRLAELSAELWITLGRGEGAAQEHVIEITDEGEGVALRCVKVGEEEMPEVSPLAVSPLAVSAPEVSAPEVSAERPHITGASEVNRRPEFDYTAPISTVSLDVKTRPLSTTQPALPNAHPSDLPSGPRPPALPSRRGTLDLEELSLRAMSTFREFRVLAHLPTQRPYQEGPGFYVLRFKPGTGHRAQALTNYTPELKLKLGLGHDQEPRHYIDEGCVVFEVPKRDEDRYFVRIDDLLARWPASADDLCAPLGEDIAGEIVSLDFSSTDSPHLLIGGTTGSGKSLALDGLLYALCALKTPAELELYLVDPKGTELMGFAETPHLRGEIGIDAQDAEEALRLGAEEMERRNRLFRERRVRDLKSYNQRAAAAERLPWRLIVLDEYADLTSDPEDKRKVEGLLQRLAAKGRSAGIHLIVATQKPSAAVISTVIRSNLPAQLALRVKTGVDSKIILDETGAEALAGKGDAFLKTARGLVRVQCAARGF